MHKVIRKILFTESEIAAICKRLGEQISTDYQGKEIIFVGLLKGCQPFFGDLLKNIVPECKVDYMWVSSYAGTETTGSITIKKDMEIDIKDKHVILVEDIVDTGITISEVSKLLLDRHPKSFEVVVFLDKPEGRVVPVDIKYIGSEVEKVYVIGYGFDYNDNYRNIPYVGILKEEIYTK